MRLKTFRYPAISVLCDCCQAYLNCNDAKCVISVTGLDFCNEDCATAYAIQLDLQTRLDTLYILGQ